MEKKKEREKRLGAIQGVNDSKISVCGKGAYLRFKQCVFNPSMNKAQYQVLENKDRKHPGSFLEFI